MRFGTVLVANRGEIALRVIKAVQASGLRAVAVYSDADREAPHVRAADTAVRLGPAPASESYLSIDAILDAARRTGAEAVHPGYGFLSERAAFARAVTDAGLVFIGPSADVIEAMGRKDEARKIAIAADVPVVPSVELSDASDSAANLRDDVTYPLLVKAAAGGGGKGMRIVREPSELADALAAARREAAAAFGDDTMLVERYVEAGRHVEVQVIGDEHGTVLHLFERDCSTQRRHQKVLEEAPAPTISEEQRKLVTDAASTSAARRSRSRTTRMPRPPPPADAFTSTGRSSSVTAAGSRSVRTGTPASAISFLAATFEPISSIDSGVGPIQVSPAAATSRAKAAFSDRNP